MLGTKLRENELFWNMAYEHKESDSFMSAIYKQFKNWNYDYSNAAMTMENYRKDFKPGTAHVNGRSTAL